MSLARRFGLTGVAVAAMLQTVHATSPCEDEPTLATEFGKNTTWGKNLQPSAAPVDLGLDDNTRWIRVAMTVENPAWNWTVTIRDAKERPLQSISSRQMTQNKPFWTDRLPTNRLQFFVESTDPTVKVRLTEYIAMSAKAIRPYYSIQGVKEQWVDLFESDLALVDTLHRRKGDAVGLFVAHSGSNLNGFKVWSCTGFLIANSPKMLFVTNDHCGGPWKADDRWTSGICETAVVDFSWDGDQVKREYGCRSVTRSPENDLAILELEKMENVVPPKTLSLRSTPLKDESITIIHHPASLPKQISLNCRGITEAVSGIDTVNLQRDFAHICDTEGGSSGAPILDKDGVVVGIHHLGFEKDTNGACDMYSKAVKVSVLIALLKGNPAMAGFEVK